MKIGLFFLSRRSVGRLLITEPFTQRRNAFHLDSDNTHCNNIPTIPFALACFYTKDKRTGQSSLNSASRPTKPCKKGSLCPIHTSRFFFLPCNSCPKFKCGCICADGKVVVSIGIKQIVYHPEGKCRILETWIMTEEFVVLVFLLVLQNHAMTSGTCWFDLNTNTGHSPCTWSLASRPAGPGHAILSCRKLQGILQVKNPVPFGPRIWAQARIQNSRQDPEVKNSRQDPEVKSPGDRIFVVLFNFNFRKEERNQRHRTSHVTNGNVTRAAANKTMK